MPQRHAVVAAIALAAQLALPGCKFAVSEDSDAQSTTPTAPIALTAPTVTPDRFDQEMAAALDDMGAVEAAGLPPSFENLVAAPEPEAEAPAATPPTAPEPPSLAAAELDPEAGGDACETCAGCAPGGAFEGDDSCLSVSQAACDAVFASGACSAPAAPALEAATDDAARPALAALGRVDLASRYAGLQGKLLARVGRAAARAKVAVKTALASGAATGRAALDKAAADTRGLTEVAYRIVDETTYELAFLAGDQQAFHLRVARGDYRIVFDTAAAGAVDDEPAGVRFFAELKVAAKTRWTARFGRLTDGCSVPELEGPSRLIVLTARDGGIWRGKIMQLLRRAPWSTAPNCTDDTSRHIGLYLDLVGDAASTTLASYAVPPGATTLDPAGHAVPRLCVNFASLCTSLDTLTSALPALANPWCIEGGEPRHGAGCVTADRDVAAGAFGPASDWLLPAEIAAYAESMPRLDAPAAAPR